MAIVILILGNENWTQTFVSQTFRDLRDIPAKSRDILPKKFDFPDFEGHTELFGPDPFTWKTPPHPKISGPKSLGLGSFFLPEIRSKPIMYCNGNCCNSFQQTEGHGWEREREREGDGTAITAPELIPQGYGKVTLIWGLKTLKS